ncbi:5-guanidino-2-oxopentanoate decarboxylase [Nakamurella leprariae]|uniref:5-guanidino-2-oxopentanoate decarboxylase n=1 Tax=Nakamurella leprariae TaxID=2803911 RepID=A0A939C3K7_9ACTN|nr:5-guanidino-2-oxopentanoate decarboxylase [Nakamurella leprariae]MBM9469524.1 5-guanidino-2-oxopentanoate decarboxylase [Nakamurella leprariae]
MTSTTLRTFGEAALDLVADTLGTDTVFGIPGVHTIELYRGVHRRGLRSVVPRHEQGAGFMADGYTRVTGNAGVCLLVTGPGLINALTPVAQAWHDSQPMLVIAATTATADLGRGRGPLHDVGDQAALAAPITSISETVTDPDHFAELLADAAAGWRTGRPRPVHLALPIDLLSRRTGPISPVTRPADPLPIPVEDITAAAARLAGARAPVLLVGGGALGAADGIRTLAERVDAPVITTGNAKGVLPEDHPLAVGFLLPFPGPLQMLADADVVLAVGTEFSEVDRIYTGADLTINGTLLRVDIDPDQLHTPFPATVGLAGDATAVLSQLLAAIPAGTRDVLADGASRAAAARDVQFTAQTDGHRPWVDALGGALTSETVVALDSTQLAYSAIHLLPARHPRTWLAPYGLGTLGPALPMAIGAGIGRPDAPVVAVAGDGGLLFTIAELATAVDVGRPLTLVVWDNAGYGEIRDSFDRAGAPRVGTETTAHDLVTIARGFGAAATRVSDPDAFARELADAADRPGVSVVVATDPAGPTGLSRPGA